MKHSLGSVLFLLAGLFVLGFIGLRLADTGFAAEEGKEDRPRAFAKLERGMTAEQVRQRVGAPRRIARQILYHRHLEQWIYDPPCPARLQFDCRRGQPAQLIRKQILAAEPPEPRGGVPHRPR